MSRKTGGSRNPRILLDIQGSITNIGWFKSIVRNAVSGNSPWENIRSLLLGNVVHIFFNPKKLISVAFSKILPIWRFLSKNSCHSFRGAWSSRVNDRYQWLQVSFRYPKKIVAIATQGRQDWNQWVISYRLTYSMDKIHYVYYKQLGVTKVCYRSVSVNRWFSLYKEYSLLRRVWSLYL